MTYNVLSGTLSLYTTTIPLYVCQTITFENLHVGRSHLHIRCISRQYGSCSYIKVIGSRSRSREQKRSTLLRIPATKNCVGQRSNSILAG